MKSKLNIYSEFFNKNTNEMRWSEAVTLQFVKIYVKYESLWNPEHPAYRYLDLKSKAYCDIAEEFCAATSISLSIEECKIKVKNLRSTYLQQLKKILRNSTPEKTYVPSLVWFHEMDRYLKHIPVNRHYYSRDTQQTSDVDSSVWPEVDNEHGSHPDPLSAEEDDSSREESSIKQELSPSPPLYKKIKKRKFKLRSRTTEETSQGTGSTEDEFDIYGKYIASQLRSIDLQKALKVQLKIQSLISAARMSDMDSSE